MEVIKGLKFRGFNIIKLFVILAFIHMIIYNLSIFIKFKLFFSKCQLGHSLNFIILLKFYNNRKI